MRVRGKLKVEAVLRLKATACNLKRYFKVKIEESIRENQRAVRLFSYFERSIRIISFNSNDKITASNSVGKLIQQKRVFTRESRLYHNQLNLTSCYVGG